MPYMSRLVVPAMLCAIPFASPASAQMPAPDTATYLMKAGASDKFEIAEAKVMRTSKNPQIAGFAVQMITDLTNSTTMIKKAAMADHMAVKPAMLDMDQKQQLSAFMSAKGAARDSLYIQQQKVAHQQALDPQQGYAAGGDQPDLKAAALQIVPVVQGHLGMLGQMPAM